MIIFNSVDCGAGNVGRFTLEKFWFEVVWGDLFGLAVGIEIYGVFGLADAVIDEDGFDYDGNDEGAEKQSKKSDDSNDADFSMSIERFLF